MTSEEIRSRFLAFFEKRGHAIIPSAPVVPENDPSVLFTTAGMQPLVPYLLGTPHPAGKRIANVQKCVRTQDIEEVGDNTHDTFFEMLGNWSLGDYFKEDAIKWSYELLTSKEEGFGLDPKRLYVTVFEGDENAPRDQEAYDIWSRLFTAAGLNPEGHIFFMGAKSNWWSPGDNGPCGPDTEMFYNVSDEDLGDLTKEAYLAADERQQVVEIWNDVFMEYEKKDGKVVGKLSQQNVDTGSGLERLVMALQGKTNIFDTDLFAPLMAVIKEQGSNGDTKAERIVADHIRTSVIMIADGVIPANTDQGYILRRLLRRAVRYADQLGLRPGSLALLADAVIEKYRTVYPSVLDRKETIKKELEQEEQKFRKTLEQGLKEFSKLATATVSGHDAFILFSTYGFPLELTEELAHDRGFSVDRKAFEEELQKHQELSRAGAEQKFKGGLADHSEEAVKYHTATHLLNQALHDVLGEHVEQKGSNITAERLRFDFSHPQKMTDEEKKRVEDIVNAKIADDLPVQTAILPKEEALKSGARHAFNEKYGDQVTIYYIGDSLENAYSKEFCGGPHVERTGTLGTFKIQKEEAVAQGVRRIKGVLF
ncbi:MAG TPA: alanine--tRNA ligase [Candidatus Paceibacterota bacterium]|nr:alanine--tRNA ligase [Candidatus Paceibacterota bacterium]